MLSCTDKIVPRIFRYTIGVQIEFNYNKHYYSRLSKLFVVLVMSTHVGQQQDGCCFSGSCPIARLPEHNPDGCGRCNEWSNGWQLGMWHPGGLKCKIVGLKIDESKLMSKIFFLNKEEMSGYRFLQM